MKNFFIAFLIAASLSATGCQKSHLKSASAKKAEAGPTLAMLPIERVHFMSGSHELVDEAREALEFDVEWLKEHPEKIILLEGHCDHTGSDEFNMELGDRRARQIEAYFIERGISFKRFMPPISYGKRKLAIVGNEPLIKAYNRRVEIKIR